MTKIAIQTFMSSVHSYIPSTTASPVYTKQLLSAKGVLSCTPNATFNTLGPAGVTLEPSLAEPSWAAQPKRKLGNPQKVASRAGKTLINSFRLGNGGPAACRNGAPVHMKQQLFQKVRSRLRKTPTWETRLV